MFYKITKTKEDGSKEVLFKDYRYLVNFDIDLDNHWCKSILVELATPEETKDLQVY